MHQTVVERPNRILRKNRLFELADDGTLVDFVVQEKGRHARALLAIDDGPVNRSGTTILGQERGMEIKRTQSRHLPNHLGQHSEGNHNAQVGL